MNRNDMDITKQKIPEVHADQEQSAENSVRTRSKRETQDIPPEIEEQAVEEVPEEQGGSMVSPTSPAVVQPQKAKIRFRLNEGSSGDLNDRVSVYDQRKRLRGNTKADLTQVEGQIFPFEKLDKKKRKMLKKAQQPSCCQMLCCCCFRKSSIMSNRRLPFATKKLVTVIDMLENLFVDYDEKLVHLLWRKEVFTPLESNKIRDDLSYFMAQIV